MPTPSRRHSIRRDLGDAETRIYNAGSGAWASVEDTSPEDFEKAWRVSALGALLTAQQVIPPMKNAAGGNIIFVGRCCTFPRWWLSRYDSWMKKNDYVFRYRIRNWPQYNQALIARGRITFWFDEDATRFEIFFDS